MRAVGTSAVVGAALLALVSPASAAPPAPRCSNGASPAGGGTPLYTTQPTPWNSFVPNELAPDQWLAKLYTEVLGCAPEQASYAAYDSLIRTTGCSLATLQTVALAFLTSREFLRHRSYNYAQRLLILWRVGRESEPDPQQYYRLLAALTAGSARWDDVVRSFFDPTGFGPAIPRLCSGQLYGWNPSSPVIDIPTSHAGAFGDGTGAQLQQLLDHAKPGDTVWLKQGAVVRVGNELVIPRGVTLETVGAPAPNQYAAMARLVRTAANGQPVVGLSSGSTLADVWVDGQRSNQSVGMDHDSIDVDVRGGSGTSVRADRIDNTSGWSNMVVDQTGPDRRPCQHVSIVGNLIDGYSTKFHWHETTGPVDGRVDTGTIMGQVKNFQSGQNQVSSTFGFADGISNQCQDSHIAANQIVDATDVSIVFFGAGEPSEQGTNDQRSVAENNTIVNAGNSGWAAMTVDPLYPSTLHADFAGATIRNNLIWTSPNAFLLLIAGIGTKPWFGDNNAYGYGAVRYVNNTSGSVRVNTQMAIAVSRMSGAIVQGNTLLANLAYADQCPHGPYIGVDQSSGSSVQSPNSPVDFGSYPTPSASQGCLIYHF
jgi:hypothetical protein